MYKITLCILLALNFSVQAMNYTEGINKKLKSIKEIHEKEALLLATASPKQQAQFLKRSQKDVDSIRQLKQEYTGAFLFERLNRMYKVIETSYEKRMLTFVQPTGDSLKASKASHSGAKHKKKKNFQADSSIIVRK